jgi:hypothetical protein
MSSTRLQTANDARRLEPLKGSCVKVVLQIYCVSEAIAEAGGVLAPEVPIVLIALRLGVVIEVLVRVAQVLCLQRNLIVLAEGVAQRRIQKSSVGVTPVPINTASQAADIAAGTRFDFPTGIAVFLDFSGRRQPHARRRFRP